MRMYELVLIIRPSFKDAELKKFLETVKGWLKGVKITKEEDLGQKPLAYTIKKETAGHYVMWQFEGEEGITAEFEQRILRNDDIIRHLLLRTK